MTKIFLNLFNISVTAGYLVLAIIVLRLVFRKMPKYIRCILWGVVGIRLLFPFSIESIFSLIPSKEVIPPEIVYHNKPQIHTGITSVDSVMNPVIAQNFSPEVGASVNPLQVVAGIASYIWVVGMVLLCVYTVVTYFLLRRRVLDATRLQENIYQSERVNSPFVLGIIKPRIYIPYHLSEAELSCVVAHEKAHIKRMDHLIKPLAFFILTVYWFKPLLWIAYILLCKDIELACDEKVIAKMDTDAKKEYSETLINLSIPHRMILASPVAFGETNVKERIKNVVHYKKPAFWMIVLSVLAVIVVAVCFLTNPKAEPESVPATDSDIETIPINQVEEAQGADDATVEATENEEVESIATIYAANIDAILTNAEENAREGYVEAKLTYVDNEEVGWDYYLDNPWMTDEVRDELAQTALKELYTLTGFNVEECTYTTDGRSRFIFGKDSEMIRKCIAFYSRDYGFTLAGENVPYMGFSNARRFHFSDVQQLDSPYHKQEFSGNGAIPAWFLEHSGVYQGQEIIGFDAINLDDTKFTHIKLNFDGGYYLVVTDDEIESFHSAMGPYFGEYTEGVSYLTYIEDNVYRDLITEMLDTGTFPASGGTPFNGNAYDNTYSVLDVDGDGKEELLINFGNAFSMAGMVYYVYDYDRVTGEIYIEHAGFPDMTFYGNGYMKEEASHNHGRSSLDDFWPYSLYKYNAQTDKYEAVVLMDAWQQQISEDSEPDPAFPIEKDEDGDGIVYYDMSGNYYAPSMIMDNAEYEEWCEQYNTGNIKPIKWYPIITEEEYNEKYPSNAVG